MREVDTFEEALARGFFNPFGLTTADLPGSRTMPAELEAGPDHASDPFFSEGTGPWGQMRDYLTLYTLTGPPGSGGPSLETHVWGVALGGTACAGSLTGDALASCIDGFVFAPDADPCTRDKLWQMFRALYLAKREELKSAADVAACGRPSIPAGRSGGWSG